jgi:uncharacterized protein YPO0396
MNDMQGYTPDNLFPVGQIRLSELTVYNWGTFDKLTTAPISKDGTLVTGDSGAGKSTLVDAWTAMMMPAGRARFNSAAANEKEAQDRSLVTYMRGAYGSERDGVTSRSKNTRDGDVVTGIRGLHTGDDGLKITLCVIFWMKGDGKSAGDVNRLYFIARRDVTLQETLRIFQESGSTGLKSWLKSDPEINTFDSNFSSYQEHYRQLFMMENKKAPALLSRALGLKEVTNLTNLVREFVLEPSEVKDKAKSAVVAFENLKVTYTEMEDARARHEHLKPLPGLKKAMADLKVKIELYEKMIASIPAYFGEVGAEQTQKELEAYGLKMDEVLAIISELQDQVELIDQRIERYTKEYFNAGGDQLSNLKIEIDNTKRRLSEVNKNASDYQKLARQLELPEDLEENALAKNVKKAKEVLSNISEQREKLQNAFATAHAEVIRLNNRLKEVESEISEIGANPDSNIPVKYQQLRQAIIDEVGGKKEDYLFFGELMEVKAEETEWQGAIERALGIQRLTLVVPEDVYSKVNRWVNGRNNRLYVRLHVARNLQMHARQRADFKDNGFLRKLNWRDHAYREMAKQFMSKFDLQCVSSTEEMNMTPFSMTKEGMIQKEMGRFEKKDQSDIGDRREWALGFSNASRLASLKEERKTLAESASEAIEGDKKARASVDDLGGKERAWLAISGLEWDNINITFSRNLLEELQADYDKLCGEGSDLKKAEENLNKAKEEKKRVDASLTAEGEKKGGLNRDIEVAEKRLQIYRDKAKVGIEHNVRDAIFNLMPASGIGNIDQAERDMRETLHKLLSDEQTARNKAEKSADKIITEFRSKEEWAPLSIEWDVDSKGVDDYIHHFDFLENDGLPALVERFRKRMNDETTNAVTSVQTQLHKEVEDTQSRIEMINEVMEKTEYAPGRILQMRCRPDRYDHVKAFDQKLRNVLSVTLNDDDEALFHKLAEVIAIMDQACNTVSLESSRLIDSRYRYKFDAEVIDKKTLEVVDYLDSSSGKSGGERESFAGVIVAASLAYVLTPDGHSQPVYSTVFLDEAFSKTAETLGSRVLNVFRELNLHVNMITPFKSINMLSKAVDSIIICEKREDTHSTSLIRTDWERLGEYQKAREDKMLAASQMIEVKS